MGGKPRRQRAAQPRPLRAPALDELAANHQVLLRRSLEAAVPFWIERLRHCAETSPQRLVERAHFCGEVIAHHADAILFATSGRRVRLREPAYDGIVPAPPPTTAEGFNRLAEGIAIAALLCPGGVRFLGAHFQA